MATSINLNDNCICHPTDIFDFNHMQQIQKIEVLADAESSTIHHARFFVFDNDNQSVVFSKDYSDSPNTFASRSSRDIDIVAQGLSYIQNLRDRDFALILKNAEVQECAKLLGRITDRHELSVNVNLPAELHNEVKQTDTDEGILSIPFFSILLENLVCGEQPVLVLISRGSFLIIPSPKSNGLTMGFLAMAERHPKRFISIDTSGPDWVSLMHTEITVYTTGNKEQSE